MFRSTVSVWRRALWLVPVSALVLLFLVLAFTNEPRAAGLAAALPAGPSSGRPVAGPAASLRVADLHALPPASVTRGAALPFHHVGSAPGSGIAGLVESLSPAGFGAPPLVVGFDGINSEQSGGSGGACGCVPPDGDMAAGPSQVIVGVNEAFRVFNKSG